MIEKCYSIALRKRERSDDRFFYHNDYRFIELDIDPKGRYWFADPFLFEKNGKVYLFYEAFDLVQHKGELGYSVVNNDKSVSKPTIIIQDVNHFSFPFVFEKDGKVFLMPESCETNNIRLYQAVNFPDDWEELQPVIENVNYVDSILFAQEGKNYLLASEQYRFPPKERVVSCWVKNRLFQCQNGAITYIEKVSEGEIGIRNAGKVFRDKHGAMIRPGQDCGKGQYGRGLVFFKVQSVCPYEEQEMLRIDYQEIAPHLCLNSANRKIMGFHTYNSSESYEVIDFSYTKELPQSVTWGRKKQNALYLLKATAFKLKKIFAYCSNLLLHQKKYEGYRSIVNKNAPWVFVSYIADPFYHQQDNSYLDLHQNKREALSMAKVLNRLGYNAYFMLYNSNKEIPNYDFKLLFGHEPNIQRAKDKFPNAKMVYYGVSTHFDYRNKKIKEMTAQFNEAFHAVVPERRLVSPHNAIKKADSILLIGSDNTINTYPEEYRGKITKIHQSTQVCKYLHYVEACGSKEFFYLASAGNVLKGIQSVIEFFSCHPEYELHWVGPVEDDVKEAIQDKLTSNIHSYGFQDISSNLVLGLEERCDFMIYPSGVEGVPGSVLNAMKSGLIPLVTPWASFDGIEKYGFVMEDATSACVEKAVDWAMSLPLDEIVRRKRACQQFVLDNYNLVKFETEFENYMRRQLQNE